MIRLLALLGWALAAAWAALWAMELSRSEKREQVLFDQVERLELELGARRRG